jgi:hypothetical protein
MKKLSTIIGQLKTPNSEGSQQFVDNHPIEVTPDANGNGDDVFKAAKLKQTNSRKADRKPVEDEKVYEEAEQVDEKHLTPAELKKREEVAQAIDRKNPNMPMGKKMAIATATAKKVAEEVEESPKFESIFEAVEAHKEQKEEADLVEAYAIVLEAIYDSLEDEADKAEFMQMMESDEDIEKLTQLVEASLGENE